MSVVINPFCSDMVQNESSGSVESDSGDETNNGLVAKWKKLIERNLESSLTAEKESRQKLLLERWDGNVEKLKRLENSGVAMNSTDNLVLFVLESVCRSE